MDYKDALGLARLLISTGMPIEEATSNPAIPESMREEVRRTLAEEQTMILRPARMIVNGERAEWLAQQDRSQWHYWPTLRQHLITRKGWPLPSVQSLDRETDRILGQIADPHGTEAFDIRGLVLGFVQSGKTANYTSLIAKAADSGFRLFIVLAGTDNGLRLQTQRRLRRELVGGSSTHGVPLPPLGKQWHEFTKEELNGDFQPGWANASALQGSQPVLLVIKKNGTVLRRLLSWLQQAHQDVMRTIPLMVIDDEADIASVDTRGSYQSADEPLPDDYEAPSVINRLIRDLLNRFSRKAYVAYTATPFANILIPHDNYDPRVSDDLYPRDFMVDLPKPPTYFGAEELFGRVDEATEETVDGIDVIRTVSDEDLAALQENQLPQIMEQAMLSFVLSGAARASRNCDEFPATMLIHMSRGIDDHRQIFDAVSRRFNELRDEWRYDRSHGVQDRLRRLWETDYVPVIQRQHPERVVAFEALEPHIGPFFEAIQIKTVNSFTGEVLDYDAEPNLKAIAIGGNKLSRGLTLEGLLVSVFVRGTVMYDTLMQMGRWFGFRAGYEDLTRIYTTPEIDQWFSDLAQVEYRLREDIKVYERQGLTPLQVGMRIKAHPTMLITSRLKQRFATRTQISQSYSGELEQTYLFPLHRPDDLAHQAENNLIVVRGFLTQLGTPQTGDKGPYWLSVSADRVLDFLDRFSIDASARNISLPLIRKYIEHQLTRGELVNWIIAVCGRGREDQDLGRVDWGLGDTISLIGRTRINDTDSLGVITNPGDETIGMSEEEKQRLEERRVEGESINKTARLMRAPTTGLIMLYPISRRSRPAREGSSRRQLYENPEGPLARDLIGLAISFPASAQPQPVEAYVQGTQPWRPVE